MTEFELIETFFKKPARLASNLLSIGDDCALLKVSAQKVAALSTDALVAGVHFFADMDSYLLGQKALLVNLSDLAAMGAQPLAFLLSLTLPETNETWLKKFSHGLLHTAETYHLDLIGGNTARGPLNINITIVGEIFADQALRRDRANTDDDIYVTGTLGGAALGVQFLKNEISLQAEQKESALARLYTPTPRVAFAQELVGIAHAAIDISDGLAQDLQHVLQASGVGAEVWTHELPLFPGANLELALNGGEDYELCFTAPVAMREQLTKLAAKHALMLSRVGIITTGKQLRFLDAHHQALALTAHGYQHFC